MRHLNFRALLMRPESTSSNRLNLELIRLRPWKCGFGECPGDVCSPTACSCSNVHEEAVGHESGLQASGERVKRVPVARPDMQHSMRQVREAIDRDQWSCTTSRGQQNPPVPPAPPKSVLRTSAQKVRRTLPGGCCRNLNLTGNGNCITSY